MDNHRTKQTAEYIIKFAKRMETYWQPQRKDDDRIYDLMHSANRLEVAEPEFQAGKTKIRPLRTGKAAIANARNTAILSSPPTVRFNPTDSTDIDSKLHASKLETFIAADWWQSQVGEVYHGQVKDLDGYARGWSNKFPLPRLWASEEYRDMADELIRLQAQRSDAEGDTKDLDKEIKALDKRMEDYLAEYYPLRWRKMSVRDTYVDWSDDIYLPEVVECLKMTGSEIERNYGYDIPGDGSQDCEVYRYHNHAWTQTVVNYGEGECVHEWEHGLGIQPCVLMEINIVDDEKGKRWRSPYLDYIDMLETEDELYSDIRHSVRRNTLAGPLFKINVRERNIDDDVKVGGRGIGEAIQYKPGEPLFLRIDEDYGLAPAPVVSRDVISLLEGVQAYNDELVLNPIDRGQAQANVSAVGFALQSETSRSRLDPYSIGVEKGVRHWTRVTIRSAIRIMEEFKGAMDKIPVTAPRGIHKGKEVEISIKDLEGWEKQAQPRISMTTPTNQTQAMANATSGLNLPVPPDWLLEQYLNVENAEELLERWMDWQVITALTTQRVEMVQQFSGDLAAQSGATSIQGLAQDIGELPPEALMALQQFTGEGQINGQTLANQRQTASLQPAVSNTVAQQIG